MSCCSPVPVVIYASFFQYSMSEDVVRVIFYPLLHGCTQGMLAVSQINHFLLSPLNIWYCTSSFITHPFWEKFLDKRKYITDMYIYKVYHECMDKDLVNQSTGKLGCSDPSLCNVRTLKAKSKHMQAILQKLIFWYYMKISRKRVWSLMRKFLGMALVCSVTVIPIVFCHFVSTTIQVINITVFSIMTIVL